MTRNAAERLAEAIAASGMAAEIADPRRFDAPLDPQSVHQGAALEVEPLDWGSVSEVCAPKGTAPLVLLLDRVTDPHNVGAILRSAEVFGARAVIAPRRHAAPETGALAKAASGALERQPYLRVPNLANAIGSLREMGYAVVGLDGAAAEDLADGGGRLRGPAAGAGARGRGAGPARAHRQALRPARPHPGGRRLRLAQRLERGGGGALCGSDGAAPVAVTAAITFSLWPFPGGPSLSISPLKQLAWNRPASSHCPSFQLGARISGRLFRAHDSMMAYSDATLREILARTRTIACVGVSKNEIRPSFYVARYLRLKGFRVIPVNPGFAGENLLGETVHPDLASLPAELGDIHMVDIFRRSDKAGAVVDEALAHLLDRGLQTIWMQIGVVDEAAAARAEARGVTVIMNRCPKIEYQRLHGELRMGGFNTGLISSRL